jgi:hypothetical protein
MASLIEVISQLYTQVSARLVQMRIDKPRSAIGSTARADIADPLIERIRKYAAENARRTDAGASPADQVVPTEGIARIAAAMTAAKGTPVSGSSQPTPNELALEFAKGPRAGALPPPVGEQLKKRTFEYINHALDLAKQGKVESAETCAKLAETALKAAAAYMSEEDYLAFEQEAMSRIAPPAEPDR